MKKVPQLQLDKFIHNVLTTKTSAVVDYTCPGYMQNEPETKLTIDTCMFIAQLRVRPRSGLNNSEYRVDFEGGAFHGVLY